MNRRHFLESVVAVSVAAMVPLPKWIGSPAGGWYAPAPDNLAELIQWTPDWVMHPYLEGTFKQGILAGAWAPPGAAYGEYLFLQVTIALSAKDMASSSLVALKTENAVRTLRYAIEQHHTPGWLRVPYHIYDTDGNLVRSEPKWRRIGYLAWLPFSALRGPTHVVPDL